MNSWNITSQLEELRGQGLWRGLRPLDEVDGMMVRSEGREWVNFSSNDYLGLAGSADLRSALEDGVAKHGAGSGASRLVCGTHKAHSALEEALADFKGTEAALCFSSGFAVSLGTIPALVGPGDTLILDKLCHASLVDGARLSGATVRVFPHNHLEKLERLLGTAEGRVLVVTESIFSMDGDASLLREIVKLKTKHGAWLMVDEAHAVGVIGPRGRGLAAELGVEAQIELQMGTLSKAFGLSGGYVAASRPVIDLLINRARSFIYTTAPPPALAHAGLRALEWLGGSRGDSLRRRLRDNVRHLTSLLAKPDAPAAILPVILGQEDAAFQASQQLQHEGFFVPCIRYPTVGRGSARLRITLSASHSAGQVAALAEAMNKIKEATAATSSPR
jgi:8-amino-7-oxononanoate synthase